MTSDRTPPTAIRPTAALCAALLLAAGLLSTVACGGLGGIDLGSILGSGGPADSSDVEGTVTRVDTRDRRIDLDVYNVNNLRESHPDSSIYYDADTVVLYNGNTYDPVDLEPGDVITAEGANVSGRYVADEIEVVRNVRSR
jgi:hypothetical protein